MISGILISLIVVSIIVFILMIMTIVLFTRKPQAIAQVTTTSSPTPTTTQDLSAYALKQDLVPIVSQLTPIANKVTTQKYDLSAYNSIQYFGDSITQGVLLTDVAQRWSALVSAALNKTEINQGIGGDQVPDSMKNIYANRQFGVPAFIAYGANDISRGQSNIDEMKKHLLSMALYCTLPEASIINPRTNTTAIVKTGQWVNTDLPKVGIMTNPASNGTFGTPPPTITATLNGRYIGFSGITVNSTSNRGAFPQYNIIVDGVNVAPTKYYTYTATTANGTPFMTYMWLYDTGVTSINGTQHSLTIAPVPVGGYSDRGFIDFFVGFDNAQPNSTPLFLMEPTDFDLHLVTDNTLIAPLQASYKRMLMELAGYLSNDLGLPVTLIKDINLSVSGDLLLDLIHPSAVGHKKISNKVLNVIQNGVTNIK